MEEDGVVFTVVVLVAPFTLQHLLLVFPRAAAPSDRGEVRRRDRVLPHHHPGQGQRRRHRIPNPFRARLFPRRRPIGHSRQDKQLKHSSGGGGGGGGGAAAAAVFLRRGHYGGGQVESPTPSPSSFPRPSQVRSLPPSTSNNSGAKLYAVRRNHHMHQPPQRYAAEYAYPAAAAAAAAAPMPATVLATARQWQVRKDI